jgi:hypothetical protein
MASKKEFLTSFRDDIFKLMDCFSPSDFHSDWECKFCGNRANHNYDVVFHASDCKGKEYYKFLSDLLEKES